MCIHVYTLAYIQIYIYRYIYIYTHVCIYGALEGFDSTFNSQADFEQPDVAPAPLHVSAAGCRPLSLGLVAVSIHGF